MQQIVQNTKGLKEAYTTQISPLVDGRADDNEEKDKRITEEMSKNQEQRRIEGETQDTIL